MAFKYERTCTKEEIFELYVNTSYFGDGYYCVKDASNGYFDKDPIDMDLYECTLLAGIPNAPSVYAPTKNPELAMQRQAQVLKKMVKYKYLTQDRANEILNIRYDNYKE
jgi:membrane peptidoglycan carboxypeptidase